MDTTIVPPVSENIEDAVYDAAQALEADEREVLLRTFFRGNPEGLARVRRMLKRRGESSAFFLEVHDQSSLLAEEVLGTAPDAAAGEEALDASGEKPGAMIGPCRILSHLGGGGSGVVYEAEQQAPARRIVALKVLRPGTDTEGGVARFKVECQALALMDHPNIARVYDAGATATGRPYLVMERICGERITTVCEREKLNLFARIRMFIQICNGIQHAHQKGVIHRDIKPSNVLVTVQDGELAPKVIDFGIAKAVDSSLLADGTHWTAKDQMVGTPPYMSPEQADMNGIDVDTRSDVYSLGALLYELLGGRPPFDGKALAQAGISEMRRILLEVDPPLVSRMLAALPDGEREQIARSRDEAPARLVGRIRGDLDWIVACAMEKDRDRRYQTVNALAMDLRRFLAHEPVIASKPGTCYLMGKFFRRNRVACLSGIAVVASLIAGLGAFSTMYLNEREALSKQELLRREAESARARESWLREQAQARANVSQAAVMLADGLPEEADALLRESPLESIEPSREAAAVFRALGDRNAMNGRWKQALQCFVLLDQANRLDDPVRIVENVDLLMIAPVFAAHGDLEAYERFRQETLDRHLPAVNALQAEHIMKVCLLTPASDEILRRLAPAAEVCAAGVQSGDHARHPKWEAFAMALYHFRCGNLGSMKPWAEKTLSYDNLAVPRVAATLCLTAMANFRAGNLAQAKQELGRAREIIDGGTRFGPTWIETSRGTWFAWVVAQLLLAEAEREIGGKARD